MNVYIRIKPPESFSQKTAFVDKNEKIITLVQKKYDVKNKPILNKYDFKFNKIFDIDYTNDDIYNHFGEDLILNFLSGYNSTFYLYGQTGSGKTHTLLGYDNEKGLLYSILNKLTQNIRKNAKKTCIKISSYQLYYNKLYDILNENRQLNGYDNGYDNFIINNLAEKDITKENFNTIIEDITKFRHISVSSENDTSSRSHLIIEIKFGNNIMRLIDLAGSEKLKNVKHSALENGDINKSILSWKECIRALKRNSKYIPYRGHMLTRILKSSFINNKYTYVLGTISCENRNSGDSLNTLKYMEDITKLAIHKNEKKKFNYRSSAFNKSINFSNILNCKNKLDNIKKQREEIINNMITRMTTSESKNALVDVLNKEIYLLEDMRNKMI